MLFTSSVSVATYNANVKGEIASVITYADGDYIYFTLKNQPQHEACNPSFFVISESVSENRKNNLLSRLLTAYAMKEAVNIGYDSKGECVHGYIRAHRVG